MTMPARAMPAIWRRRRTSAAGGRESGGAAQSAQSEIPGARRWCSIRGCRRGLLGHFAGAISGTSIARGISFLKDKMGQRVFAPAFTIIDDPHRVRGRRSKPFDGEGVANARRALIENGVLTTWLLDCASAKQLGLDHHRPCGARHRRPADAVRDQSLYGAGQRCRRKS